ncbi:MAG: hypothetical protein DHS20C19_08810 [Acidimicrobiales bacterium]|nr:MAG: hypothetical protein DHS20C19_08810 [Acidimicrobiales bacterium]
MAGDAHYRELGVDPSASAAEVRRAYLSLARDAHPDFHTGSESGRRRAEERMRRINAAWAVLGDVDARADYDRARLRGTPRPTFHAASHGSVDGADPWRPFDEGDPLGFDDRDDRPITNSALPSWMKTVPALGILFGLAALISGALVGFEGLALIGLYLVLLSIGLFLAAPLVALSMSRSQDRRP